ncbi:MAG: hypothetical protein Ct9H300mP1_10900 [Planctomycetaceae bacterium]|nr:MAG: hypothetical protein Ct9H300mP1_10900 [Planctomycetaceae bacterium]
MTIVSTNQLVVRRPASRSWPPPTWRSLPANESAFGGGNGTGKTTLLRVLAGLEPAPPEMVTFDCAGPRTSPWSPAPLAVSRRRLGNIEYGLAARRINRSRGVGSPANGSSGWGSRIGRTPGRGSLGWRTPPVALAGAPGIEPKLLCWTTAGRDRDAGIAMTRGSARTTGEHDRVITSRWTCRTDSSNEPLAGDTTGNPDSP